MSIESNIDHRFQLDDLVETLKQAAEPSRLRILRLLSEGDLTVSDLTTILGQSQPRVSRHLKLLAETGLIRRWQEGSWAFFRLNTLGERGALVSRLIDALESSDPVVQRDLERLDHVKTGRREKAAEYFTANAKSWDKIRTLHAADDAVEQKLLALTGKGPFNAVLDIGTGTGRMLELYAPFSREVVGIDSNREMLTVARANLEEAGISTAEVRLGDVHNLDLPRDAYDLVIIHQVLHFLDDPEDAIREAARVVRPGGRLVIVDFAAHDQEFLRNEHQHRRLGFSDEEIFGWVGQVDLVSSGQESIVSDKAGAPLTVKIWVAKDTRIEIAGSNPAANGKEFA